MGRDDSRFAFIRGPKVRRALALAGAAVVLGAVIFAGAALSAPRRSEPPRKVVTSLSPVAESQRLVSEAEDALASGETTQAKELLREALALDPSSEKAADLLGRTAGDDASTDASAADEPSEADPSGGGPVDEQPFEDKIPVASLLPTAVPGYALGTVVGDAADAVVTAEPLPGSPAYRKLVRVLLTVRDRGSSTAADRFVNDVSRKLYSQDVATVRVEQTPAYFGTDGKRLATLVFVRGRYVFEVLGTADTVTAAATQQYLIPVAAAFPTEP